LYAHFRTLREEIEIAEYLIRHHRTISLEDMAYFGIPQRFSGAKEEVRCGTTAR
jgi:hypothetical protein